VVLSEITGAAQSRANRYVPAGDLDNALWRDEFNTSVRMFAVGRALTQPECADYVPRDMVAKIHKPT
jgi:hypothetical protein